MDKYSEKRPWGKFDRYTNNQKSTVKILTILPDAKLSLQYHNKRDEFWKILKGNPTIFIGESITKVKEGDEFYINKKSKHSMEANDLEVEVLEISLGEFDEDDIVRISDKYGRV